MALVLIESPNKIPKLKKLLGPKYTIMASVGHIMDLPKGKLGIDTKTFEAVYKINPDKKEITDRIKEEAKKHEDIYLATDLDREGERISYDLTTLLPKRGVNIYRVRFNAIAKEAVEKAFKNPSELDKKLCESQQARRFTDRLVGFKVSSILWSKGLRGTSAGRVQSVALKYIADREKEIRAFIPEEYWTIVVDTTKQFKAEFYAINDKKFVPSNQQEADEVVNDMRKGKKELLISEYKQQTRKRSPAPPFETSTLQQAASAAFGWKVEKIMDVAQSIFSKGLISYHRTDSVNIDPTKLEELRQKILDNHGDDYLSPKVRIYSSKEGSQEAHEAIRPTYEAPVSALSSDEKKLLDLIDRRFMASQMADAVFDQVSVKLDYPGKKTYNFKANGSVMQFDGFLKVYGETKGDELLPALKAGEQLSWKSVTPAQHFTQPPGRYSDASLVKRLKEDGVGRPSTYANIIKTLDDRKYIERANKSFKATEIGIIISDYLSKFFSDLTSPEFTAQMEDNLDKIASGNIEFTSVMTDFYSKLSKEIESAKVGDASEIFRTKIECKLCKGKMIRKVSRNEVFLGCEHYPTCGFTINYDEDGKPQEVTVETGEPCPKCSSLLIKRKSKKGQFFFGCSGYPNCNFSAPIDKDGKMIKFEGTGIICQACKEGELVKRKSKHGEFLSCNRYPDCKTIVSIDQDGKPVVKKKAKDTGQKCPKCKKSNLVERNGPHGIFIACSGFPKCRHISK